MSVAIPASPSDAEVEAFLMGAVERLKRLRSVRMVVLFGSRQQGSVHPDSDLDLLVVIDDPSPPLERQMLVEETVGIEEMVVPVDIICLTPARLEERLQEGSIFLSRILTEGRVLHEA